MHLIQYKDNLYNFFIIVIVISGFEIGEFFKGTVLQHARRSHRHSQRNQGVFKGNSNETSDKGDNIFYINFYILIKPKLNSVNINREISSFLFIII